MCTYTLYEQRCRECAKVMNAVHLRVQKCCAKIQEQEAIQQRIEEQRASSPASPSSPATTFFSPALGITTTIAPEPTTPTKRGTKRKAADRGVDDATANDNGSGSGSGSDDPFAAAITSPPSAKRQRRSRGQAGRGSPATPVGAFALGDPIPFRLAIPASPSPEVEMKDFAAPPAVPVALGREMEGVLLDQSEEAMNIEVEQNITYESTVEAEDVVMSDSDEDWRDRESEKSEEMELECIQVQEAEIEKDWGLCVKCGGPDVETNMRRLPREMDCSAEVDLDVDIW
ncbi:hypothetical protein V8F20_010746 [Naviculisporaceae sp. PSN 640]